MRAQRRRDLDLAGDRIRDLCLERGLRGLLRGFDFFVLVRLRSPAFAFEARFCSARRARAHPGLLACLPRATASASGGTFSVITDPAPTYAPSPTRTGATSAVSLPMKARLPMVVACFAAPS